MVCRLCRGGERGLSVVMVTCRRIVIIGVIIRSICVDFFSMKKMTKKKL